MRCRAAEAAEAPALAALWQAAFGEEPDTVAALLPPLLRDGAGLVLEEAGELRAMLLDLPATLLPAPQAAGEPWEMDYVYAFCTHPAHQGRGYGTALLRWAEARAKARGSAGVFLVPGEEHLFQFYEKLGYRRAFPRKCVTLPPPQGGRASGHPLSPVAYEACREAALQEGTMAYLRPGRGVLEAQEALSRLSGGGGLRRAEVDGHRYAAAVEGWPEEPVIFRELVGQGADLAAVAAAFCAQPGMPDPAAGCQVWLPPAAGETEGVVYRGMVKWLGNRRNDWCWLGLTLE